MINRRQLLAVVPGLAVLSATGCSATKELTLRMRIGRGVDKDSLLHAALSDPATDVKPLAFDTLPQWQIVDVSYTGVSHPQRWFLAVTRDGDPEVVVLSGSPQRWKQITAGATVDSAAAAELVAKMWFDWTRSMATLGYRVESVDDIRWASRSSAEVERVKKRIAGRHPLNAPKAVRSGADWRLTLWTMDNQTLIEHTLAVSAAAVVTDRAVEREEDLPAVIGI